MLEANRPREDGSAGAGNSSSPRRSPPSSWSEVTSSIPKPSIRGESRLDDELGHSMTPSSEGLLSKLTFGLLGGHRREHLNAEKAAKSAGATIGKMSKELPGYLDEAKEEVKETRGRSIIGMAKGMWKLWEKFTDIAPSPWNKVLKVGVPIVAGTTGLIFYQAVVQLGIEALKTTGGLIAPLATAAAFLVPTFTANKILTLGEKLFHADPITGWKRQAILRPAQGALIIGAAIWAQTMNLNMLSYGLWGAAVVGTAFVASKVIKSSPKTVWAAAALALVLPWGHIATMRSYDVTVLSAGPDPEVAAWNIGTDLSVKDHWMGLAGLGSQATPTGKSGMVLINRDVPLYLPPHRSANAFNADFSTLIGKQVRVTTIGGWMKFISPKLQPTIVKYEVLGDGAAPVQIVQPGK